MWLLAVMSIRRASLTLPIIPKGKMVLMELPLATESARKVTTFVTYSPVRSFQASRTHRVLPPVYQRVQ